MHRPSSEQVTLVNELKDLSPVIQRQDIELYNQGELNTKVDDLIATQGVQIHLIATQGVQIQELTAKVSKLTELVERLIRNSAESKGTVDTHLESKTNAVVSVSNSRVPQPGIFRRSFSANDIDKLKKENKETHIFGTS